MEQLGEGERIKRGAASEEGCVGFGIFLFLSAEMKSGCVFSFLTNIRLKKKGASLKCVFLRKKSGREGLHTNFSGGGRPPSVRRGVFLPCAVRL